MCPYVKTLYIVHTIVRMADMEIQKKLNNRPRKKLNYSTPKIEFFKHFV